MIIATELYERIVAAKLFIDENYQEPINLDEISRQAFLSRFHFHRLFSRIYKKTPHQYLTLKRIDRAKQLLTEEKTVSEVLKALAHLACCLKKKWALLLLIIATWPG